MKNFKIIVVLLIGFYCPLTVQAMCSRFGCFPFNPQGPWVGNWLMGVSGGYVYRNGNFELNMGHPNFELILPIETTHLYKDLDDSGLIYGLFGGYQAFYDRYLLGIELSINWDNVNELDEFAFTDGNIILNSGVGWEAAVRYRRQAIYGLVIRAGIIETRYFMPYVRFGGEMSDDQLYYAAATDPSITLAPTPSNSVITWGVRWQYYLVGGIGFEIPMTCNRKIALRMDMNFHSRGKGVDAKTFAEDELTYVRANGRTRSNFAQAAFVWNFI